MIAICVCLFMSLGLCLGGAQAQEGSRGLQGESSLGPQTVLQEPIGIETKKARLTGQVLVASAGSTLKGTVLDDATGALTACTVRIVCSDGTVIETDPAFRGGFRSGGTFDVVLPAGDAKVIVTRGFETLAVEDALTLLPGEVREVEYRLARRVDLRGKGWFSGDSHAHMIHGERDIPVSFDAVALAARAEDLQYLSLAHDWIIPDAEPEQLEAELSRVSTPRCVLTWNMEAPKNYYKGDAGRCLGHGWNLNMAGRTPEGTSAIRLLLQSSAHDYEVDEPTFLNFESHALIHSLGGAVFYTHPFRWWWGEWGGQAGYPRVERMRVSNMGVELPLDTLLGPTYDGLDVLTTDGEVEANERSFRLWMQLLNHGYRLAATASSDSTFDRAGGGRPGSVRVYTYLDGPFSLPAVAAAVAKGRNFVTNGPLVLASLDARPPGTRFEADGRSRRLEIQVWASGRDAVGLREIEIFRNGEVWHTFSYERPILHSVEAVDVSDDETAWYCVRVRGGAEDRQQAISGAFFLEKRGFETPRPVRPRVRVRLLDRQSGAALSGSVAEIRFSGPIARSEEPRRIHEVGASGAVVEVEGTARLEASLPGYSSMVLSPILDSPGFMERITGMTDEELGRWETFEAIGAALGNLEVTFQMERLKGPK